METWNFGRYRTSEMLEKYCGITFMKRRGEIEALLMNQKFVDDGEKKVENISFSHPREGENAR